MKEQLRRMRTINQIIELIKEDDPNSWVTKYMIRTIADKYDIHNVVVGKRHLYDLDAVLKGLGILYE